MPYDESMVKLAAAIDLFPPKFGLRAWPEDIFRISIQTSYINDNGQPTLYTEIYNKELDSWAAFAKGTVEEIGVQVVRL